jgi:uncharacterized MAPEG superfamily protein
LEHRAGPGSNPAAGALGQSSGGISLDSSTGAKLYLAARVAYVPLYAAAIPLLRSLVWNIAFVGIALILLALL